MPPKIHDWWRKWKFGFILSALLVFFEVAILTVAILLAPRGWKWLGDLAYNAADYPVYFNYLGQSRTSFLLLNLYKDLPQIARFDAFWSIGGLLVRFGLTPIVSHELLRWACTILLAFAIYAMAKWHTSDERQARIASLWLAAGAGSGWIFAFILNFMNRELLVSVPPDASSSFALAPTLTGGAHLILSFALQLVIARWIWIVLKEKDRKLVAPTIIAVFALACFHPYYIPLVGLICCLAWLLTLRREVVLRNTLFALAVGAAMLPSTWYHYQLMQQDKVFRSLYFEVNQLPLHEPRFWLMSLLPIIIAGFWLIRKKVPSRYANPHAATWAWVWIVSAIICMLLPFPWKAKYTQGLLPAMTLLTLPFWLWVTDLWLSRTKNNLLRFLAGALILSAPFLYIIFAQSCGSSEVLRDLFYQPQAVFSAWRYIDGHAPQNAMVLAADDMVGLWTPAYTLRHVWIGHGYETPDYAQRHVDLKRWEETTDRNDFNRFLDDRHITYLMATTEEETKRYSGLLSQNWHPVFSEDQVTVYAKP